MFSASTAQFPFIDRDQAHRQLTYLGRKPGDDVHLRLFYHSLDPRKHEDKGRKLNRLNYLEVQNLQKDGRGVYVVVNIGGHEDKDITRTTALFCEWDDLPLEVQVLMWQTVGMPEPTFTVYSGDKSMQPYWCFEPGHAPSPEQWEEMQRLLIEVMGADRSNKNLSRVFRLAGAWHIKPGRDPVRTEIVQDSGKLYKWEELLENLLSIFERINPQQPKIFSQQPQQPSITDLVPLYQCLTKDDRALIDNGATSNRNTQGAKLARNLIGTAARLNYLGIRSSCDPYQIFIDYCHRCRQGDGWNEREWESIWKSAQKNNPTASMTDDAIKNCAEAWLWKQRQQNQQQQRQPISDSTQKSTIHEKVATLDVDDDKLTRREAIDLARAILTDEQDELVCNLKLEDIREAAGISSFFWENKILKPLKKDINSLRFKFDLANLLAIDDKVERIRQQALLAPIYQMSAATIETALREMKARQSTPETKVFSFLDLLNLESEGLKWLIPELLPKGETIIIAGSPKSGKTLLSFDTAYALVTGESDFLGIKTESGKKVLFIQTDESLQSTKSKLLKRGFRAEDTDLIRILPQWSITQLGILEEQLEAFRPDVVIVDSLRRINHGSEISENSAEFADNIYTLKELFAKYNASGILIHHTNKCKEALGVERLRGSSAIAGAVWGTWQLDQIPKPDPNNKKKQIIDPKDPNRILSIFARDTEGQTLNIQFNPEDNSWTRMGAADDEQEQTICERILYILQLNCHCPGLRGKEIIELLGMSPEEGRGVYTALNRMVSKRIISCHPVPGTRYSVYSLPGATPPPPPPPGGGWTPPDDEPPFNPSSPSSDGVKPESGDSTSSHTPPPPTVTVSTFELSPELPSTQGIEVTQQLTQQLENSTQQEVTGEKSETDSTPDVEPNTESLNNNSTTQGGGGIKSKKPYKGFGGSLPKSDKACSMSYKRGQKAKRVKVQEPVSLFIEKDALVKSDDNFYGKVIAPGAIPETWLIYGCYMNDCLGSELHYENREYSESGLMLRG